MNQNNGYPQAAGIDTSGSIFDTSAGAYNAGVTGIQSGMNPVNAGTGIMASTVAPGALPMTMNQLMSPYLNDVVNNTVTRLRQRKDIDLNNVKGQAAQASAYGGARQGLVEAELMDRYGQQEDDVVSRLLQQGFDTTSSLAMNELGRQANVGQGLVGAGATQANIGGQLVNAAPTGYGMGQAAVGAQSSAGAQQQSLVQQLLSMAGQQTDTAINWPQTSLANIMAGLQGNPLNNATTTTQTKQYNPGAMDFASGIFGILGGK